MNFVVIKIVSVIRILIVIQKMKLTYKIKKMSSIKVKQNRLIKFVAITVVIVMHTFMVIIIFTLADESKVHFTC